MRKKTYINSITNEQADYLDESLQSDDWLLTNTLVPIVRLDYKDIPWFIKNMMNLDQKKVTEYKEKIKNYLAIHYGKLAEAPKKM